MTTADTAKAQSGRAGYGFARFWRRPGACSAALAAVAGYETAAEAMVFLIALPALLWSKAPRISLLLGRRLSDFTLGARQSLRLARGWIAVLRWAVN